MTSLLRKKGKGTEKAQSSEAPRFKSPFHEAHFKGKLSARKVLPEGCTHSLHHHGENINVEEIITEQFYKFIYKTDLSSSLPFPSIIAAICLDAKVTTLKDDTLINQELPIAGEALIRTREGRARNPRQEAPPP
ncbi:hypothetical protein PIB30_040923 [Stylosanthes scabra]|uniref:Uncharacterized protein n=1 Tax=Stylosanthes scabra TaxID=79078 RepID=A0ABU6XEW1_9FABA|nr:hypothetical protein [Stylosanthes scabra]